MATPTVGPNGTTNSQLIFDPTGTNADPIASGWTNDFTQTGHSNWTRVSNKMAAGSGGTPSAAQAYRSDATYGLGGAGSEIWFEMNAIGASTQDIDPTLMLINPKNATFPSNTPSFYQLFIINGSPDSWGLGRVTAGSFTDLTTLTTPASATGDLAAGDYVAFAALPDGSGNIILRAYQWAISGSSWTQRYTYTDSSGSKNTTDGYFGLESTASSAFRVGSIYGGAIPTWTPETNSNYKIRTVTSGARW